MTVYDPSIAPRQRDSGYKGDGWIVTLPSDGSESVLALDTGAGQRRDPARRRWQMGPRRAAAERARPP